MSIRRSVGLLSYRGGHACLSEGWLPSHLLRILRQSGRVQCCGAASKEDSTLPLQTDLLHRTVRLRAKAITSAKENVHKFKTIPTHDLFERRVVSWSGGAAVAL